MAIDTKQLREEAVKLQKECEDRLTLKLNEKREYSEVEKTTQDTAFSRLKQINEILDEQKQLASFAFSEGKVELPVATTGKKEFQETQTDIRVMDGSKLDKVEFSKAVSHWGLTGEMDRKFATITTATNSGILLPKQVIEPITPSTANAYRDGHTVYGLAPLSTATTALITVPVLDATAGGVVAENATTDTQNPPSMSESIALTPQTFESGSAWFSNQQLQALDFDITQSVLPQLAYSKELGLENAINAAITSDSSITQIVNLDAGVITYAKLVELNRRLPRRYDRLKVIVLDSTAYAAAEKLVGADGHPVLAIDPQNQELKRFNGTPVFRSDFTGRYGDTDGTVIGVLFSLLGFRLRGCAGATVTRYTNVPTYPNQTGFNLFSYHAVGWAPSAMAKLTT